MKISSYPDLRKSIDIETTETDDSLISLQGDTVLRAKNRLTGEQSTIATLTQSGEMDFSARPSVGGVDVALATDGEGSLETQERTIVDNATTIIALCPVQEVVTVIYSLANTGANEKGFITITKGATSFGVNVEQHASDGYFADIEFNVSENNGSLLLSVIGSGAGLITDFKYRVNSVNTLYL